MPEILSRARPVHPVPEHACLIVTEQLLHSQTNCNILQQQMSVHYSVELMRISPHSAAVTSGSMMCQTVHELQWIRRVHMSDAYSGHGTIQDGTFLQTVQKII